MMPMTVSGMAIIITSGTLSDPVCPTSNT